MKNTVINTVNGVLDSNNVEDVKMVNVKNTKYRLYISRSDINNTTRYIVPVNSVEEASKAYQQMCSRKQVAWGLLYCKCTTSSYANG